MSGTITTHFSWDEVEHSATAARLHINNEVPAQLRANVELTAKHMEGVRHYLGDAPLRVTSWYRCPQVNKAVGGSKTSKHMEGLAVDFQPLAMTLQACFEMLAASHTIPFDQLIIEGTKDGAHWIHIGFTTGTPRREIMRAHGDTLGGPMSYERVALG